MTAYLCVYCDDEFEYVSDRDEHERTCRNHPAAVKERQRVLDEVRDLLNDLEAELHEDEEAELISASYNRGEKWIIEQVRRRLDALDGDEGRIGNG